MSIQSLLSQDSSVHVLSECFAVHSDLANIIEEFSEQSHLLPMSDTLLLGVAIGMAIDGSFPIVQLADIDSLYSLLPQLYRETKSGFPLGMVLKMPCPDLRAVDLNLFSGLAVSVYCAQNKEHSDALIAKARLSRQPTIILESLTLMSSQKKKHFSGDVEVLLEGTDVSLLVWGDSINIALELAEEYASQDISLEIIALHRLSSADSVHRNSVNKTGRVVCINQNDSLSKTLFANSFWYLEAEPVFCSAETSAIASAIQKVLAP